MNAMRLKLILVSTTLILTVSFLAYAGVQSGGWIYAVEVDEYMGNAAFQSQRVRLHGVVAAENFQVQPSALSARFTLQSKSRPLVVAFRGIIPDQFQAGSNVLVEGKLADDGTFHADVLMTKCASKYEPDSPHLAQAGAP